VGRKGKFCELGYNFVGEENAFAEFLILPGPLQRAFFKGLVEMGGGGNRLFRIKNNKQLMFPLRQCDLKCFGKRPKCFPQSPNVDPTSENFLS
jgi:hypothetical protein